MMLLLTLLSMFSISFAQQNCTSQLTALFPCLQYVQGQLDNPPQSCCSSVESVAQADPMCLCTLLSSSTSGALPVTINTTLALELPSKCNLKGLNPNLCTGNPRKSPLPVPNPAATGPVTAQAQQHAPAPAPGPAKHRGGGHKARRSPAPAPSPRAFTEPTPVPTDANPQVGISSPSPGIESVPQTQGPAASAPFSSGTRTLRVLSGFALPVALAVLSF